MKYRLDMVTNSSSSSFVCDVCGNVEGGWDMCLSDAEMMECQNGHTFCEYHNDTEMTREEKIKFMLENEYSKYLGYDNEKHKYTERPYEEAELQQMDEDELEETFNPEGNSEVPACLCPICTMKEIADDDIISYALTKLGMTKGDLEVEIREKFKSTKELKSYLSNSK